MCLYGMFRSSDNKELVILSICKLLLNHSNGKENHIYMLNKKVRYCLKPHLRNQTEWHEKM